MHQWFVQWFVSCLLPNHCLDQCWCIVQSSIRNDLQLKLNQNESNFSFPKTLIQNGCLPEALCFSKWPCVHQTSIQLPPNLLTINMSNYRTWVRKLSITSQIQRWNIKTYIQWQSLQSALTLTTVIPAFLPYPEMEILLFWQNFITGCTGIPVQPVMKISSK